MASRTYKILCLSEAVAPITHMARTEGNEAVVAREEVVTPSGKRQVSYLSGNAFRHRAVREPGGLYLIDTWGLSGKLTLDQLNFLLHGGALTRGAGRENTRLIADYQRISPLGRLLGGCIPGQILKGSLLVGRGVLVCEENRETIGKLWGDVVGEMPVLRAAESFVSDYQYTCGDARNSHPRLTSHAAPSFALNDDNRMIFAGQAVTRGALFLHDFILPNVAEVELGALLWSLRLWQADGGTIGGQAARGHGRLATAIVRSGGDAYDADAAVAAYLAHIEAAKDEGAQWLDAAFAEPEQRKAKGKNTAKTATAPA